VHTPSSARAQLRGEAGPLEMSLASGDAYVNRKAPKIPDGYVWKDYHDPWAKYREMQPRLKHPVAPSPAESHECEATMDMLQEGKPRIQFLMRQPGVREAVFAVLTAKARMHAQEWIKDERVFEVILSMMGAEIRRP